MAQTSTLAAPFSTADPRRWWALAVLGAAQFVIVLDATIVNVGIASIQRDLNFFPENLTWVVNSCVPTFGSLLLLGGRLGDRLGRRSVFTAGLDVFAAAALTLAEGLRRKTLSGKTDESVTQAAAARA